MRLGMLGGRIPLVLMNGFHGFKLSLDLREVVTRDLVDVTLVVMCLLSVSFPWREQFGDGPHEVRTVEIVLVEVHVELLAAVLKGQFVQEILLVQILGKELRSIIDFLVVQKLV